MNIKQTVGKQLVGKQLALANTYINKHFEPVLLRIFIEDTLAS